MLENLNFVKEIGLCSQKALESGCLEKFAELMNAHWEYKKRRSGAMSNPQIDEWYELALKNGALGGKLIGAGGGGFLLFYCNDKKRCRHALTAAGMREVRFHFDFEGTKIVTQ
jgi:D-glycero-alpha-D-manno-heptose-7-phosphate kinase